MESKIEKLKKWLDEKPANWWGTSKTMSHIWGRVCMLVAEEQAESHPAALEPLALEHKMGGMICPSCSTIVKYPHEYQKKEESLEELADKRFFGVSYGHNLSADEPYRVTIITGFDTKKKFHADSYAACEQLARTWLEEQEDK